MAFGVVVDWLAGTTVHALVLALALALALLLVRALVAVVVGEARMGLDDRALY